MGGRSSSSSSSTQKSYMYDNRAAVSDDGKMNYANIHGSDNSISIVETDHEAVSDSLNLVGKSLDHMLEFADDTRRESFQRIGENSDQAIAFANDAYKTADERQAEKLLPTMAITGVSAVAIVAYYWSKKK